jgi:hypothetical protein
VQATTLFPFRSVSENASCRNAALNCRAEVEKEGAPFLAGLRAGSGRLILILEVASIPLLVLGFFAAAAV